MLVRFVRPLAGFALRVPALISIRGYAKASSPIVNALKTAKSVVAKATVKKPAKKVAAKRKPVAKKKPIKKAIKKKPKKPIVKKPRLVANSDVPRPPGSPFALFVKNRQPSHSGLPVLDRLKAAASEWHALPETDKNDWKSRANAAKEDYHRIYEQYITGLSPVEIAKENSIRRKLKRNGQKRNIRPLVDSRRPKKPLSAFFLFLRETRDSSLPPMEIGKRAGEAWRSMSDGEKAKYTHQAKTEYAKYKEAMKTYMGTA